MGLDILKEITGVLDAAVGLLQKLSVKSKKKEYADAISAIQTATIATPKFIRESRYIENTVLSTLWIDAMNKTINAGIGDDLPRYLMDKAKFWGDPQVWLANPTSLTLVPKLNDLDQKCEMLLIELR